MKKISVAILLAILSANVFAQITTPGADVDWLTGKVEDGARIISTGVPLLLIAPDSRAGAMGDLGAASTPDERIDPCALAVHDFTLQSES